MAGLGGFVILLVSVGVWLYLTYWVASNAYRRGSTLWPIHGVGTFALGILYAFPYWLVTRGG